VKESSDIPADESPNLSIGSAAAIHNVEIDEIARDAIDEHVSSDTHVEKGGILVGDVEDSTGRVTIVAAVPANRAVSAPASLTFTHEAWDEVNEVLARDYPDHRMVGWYHSHPRFGIFLSEYDTFIQSNFFSVSWQLAYVVDPVLGKAGFFGWENGQLVQDWIVLAHGGAKSVREPERGAPSTTSVKSDGSRSVEFQNQRIRQWIRYAVITVLAVLVGLLLGDRLAGSGSSPASSGSAPPIATNGMVVSRSWYSFDGAIGGDIWITNLGTNTVTGTVTHCIPLPQDLQPSPVTTKPPKSQTKSRGKSPLNSCQIRGLAPDNTAHFVFSAPSQSNLLSSYGTFFSGYPPPTFQVPEL
jgi:proteasome lid subunit RPN8/RPN11